MPKALPFTRQVLLTASWNHRTFSMQALRQPLYVFPSARTLDDIILDLEQALS
jgi:hypothetical protein